MNLVKPKEEKVDMEVLENNMIKFEDIKIGVKIRKQYNSKGVTYTITDINCLAIINGNGCYCICLLLIMKILILYMLLILIHLCIIMKL